MWAPNNIVAEFVRACERSYDCVLACWVEVMAEGGLSLNRSQESIDERSTGDHHDTTIQVWALEFFMQPTKTNSK